MIWILVPVAFFVCMFLANRIDDYRQAPRYATLLGALLLGFTLLVLAIALAQAVFTLALSYAL